MDAKRLSSSGRMRAYQLDINRRDLMHLVDFSFGGPVASDITDDGARFYLYEHPGTFDREFRLHPDGDAYFCYVGCRNFRKLNDLSNSINRRRVMPIVINGIAAGSKVTIGYVILRASTN